MRPKVAPTAIDGTKMPAGTLQPYERIMKPVRTTVASRSVLTFRHWAHVLQVVPRVSSREANRSQPASYTLAEVVVVAATLALLEEDRHALGHVDAKELVEVGDERGRC